MTERTQRGEAEKKEQEQAVAGQPVTETLSKIAADGQGAAAGRQTTHERGVRPEDDDAKRDDLGGNAGQ